ncbi:MAG: AAA family ATPase [Prevotella sp.]|nr:AAA family ATPase [Prevotella sp.]
MSEQDNKIPLPGEPDAQEQRLAAIRPYLLDPREDYPEPYYMLEYNGVPFSTLGGIQAISGQKKNGKSFVLTQLMAACLGGNDLYLPGLRVPERTIEYLGHQPKVLYIDTEMEKLNSAKVLRRVHWLCGWDMKIPNDRFNVLWLKTMPKDEKLPAYKKRFELIKIGIEVLEPDIVFIDGLRDLMQSINDEESATTILDYLSSTAEERHMCIWNALHQNPKANSDGEDAKMRGWTGTELGNKVSDTLVSIKSKTASGVTFTVKQVDARGKDLDDWKFEITDDAGSLGIPKITSNGSQRTTTVEADSIDDIRRWIHEATNRYQWPMSRKSVKQTVFGEIGGVKNDGRQQADLMAAINTKLLVESTLKSGGYYMLTPNEQLPF